MTAREHYFRIPRALSTSPVGHVSRAALLWQPRSSCQACVFSESSLHSGVEGRGEQSLVQKGKSCVNTLITENLLTASLPAVMFLSLSSAFPQLSLQMAARSWHWYDLSLCTRMFFTLPQAPPFLKDGEQLLLAMVLSSFFFPLSFLHSSYLTYTVIPCLLSLKC